VNCCTMSTKRNSLFLCLHCYVDSRILCEFHLFHIVIFSISLVIFSLLWFGPVYILNSASYILSAVYLITCTCRLHLITKETESTNTEVMSQNMVIHNYSYIYSAEVRRNLRKKQNMVSFTPVVVEYK
jgi:hypothetical protein